VVTETRTIWVRMVQTFVRKEVRAGAVLSWWHYSLHAACLAQLGAGEVVGVGKRGGHHWEEYRRVVVDIVLGPDREGALG
jgi:hypothetical protein